MAIQKKTGVAVRKKNIVAKPKIKLKALNLFDLESFRVRKYSIIVLRFYGHKTLQSGDGI